MPSRKFRDGGAKIIFFIREEGHSGMKEFGKGSIAKCCKPHSSLFNGREHGCTHANTRTIKDSNIADFMLAKT